MHHRDILWLSQVGEFAYTIPSAPGDEGCIIYIDLVLTMGWVDSPKFFCTFLDTLKYVSNTLVDMELPSPSYGSISKIH